MLQGICSTKAFPRVRSYIMRCAHEDVCVEGTTLWMRMLSSTHLDEGCPSSLAIHTRALAAWQHAKTNLL